ncbi:hypothetical protein [Actinophytocola sp.]|uniref:hypothetical protein n=1 Tax=Actinophytocola sp. TaxID=1872138 RepID=UPI003899BED3
MRGPKPGQGDPTHGMMDVVADNEQRDPGADLARQPRGATPPPAGFHAPADPSAPGPPPATRPPTEVTPEQIRQFQEFQRFQELMREQAARGLPPGTPPPPGFLQPWGQPPPKQSLPKRLLKAAVSKVVTGLVVLAVLIAAGYFAVDYFLGEDNSDHPQAHETGGGKTKDNLILDTNPFETVRKVYHHIANGENGVPEQVCLRFQDRGAKFAADMGYDNCTDAVHGLAAKVTDADAYAESMPSYKTTFDPSTASEITISSCADNLRGGIQGGPSLGVFTVKKIQGSRGGQWIIADHENEPTCAVAPTGPSN